jgi:hypothetical protein
MPQMLSILTGLAIGISAIPGSLPGDPPEIHDQDSWLVAQRPIDLSENFLAAVASLASQLNTTEADEPVPNPHNGVEATRLQTMAIDQALVGVWYLYDLQRSPGTSSLGRLVIGADKAYAYGSVSPGSNTYTGSLRHAVPFRYRRYDKTYWMMGQPNDRVYLRSGEHVNGTPTIMVYSADTNRIVAFGIPGR